MYHFIEKMSFPPHVSDSEILCGKVKNNNVRATNNPYLVSCPSCLKKINKCSVCGCFVSDSDINVNEFFIGCKIHKQQAQELTERYFRENPDYTKWQP